MSAERGGGEKEHTWLQRGGGGFSAHTEKGDGPDNLDHFSGSTRILVEPIGLQHASWNVLPLISAHNYCDTMRRKFCTSSFNG